ncbi:stAR-related lipid transfer 3, partial [Brachionus plicatilis]
MPSNRLTAENANFLLNCSEIELNLKATRRSFVLFLFFDFTFTSLLWLIYCTTKGLSIEEAYEEEIKKYNIDSSLFDVAVASVVRFIFLNLFYTIFKINHWIPAAIITFASSSFLISKVIIFAIKGTHKIITDYLILIISFLIVWGQTGYLDMKIFSIVKKKAVLLDTDSTISNTSRANYGSVNAPRGILSEVPSFYASPLDSPRDFSDEENDSQSIKSFLREDQRRSRFKNSKSIRSTLTNIPEAGKNSQYLEFEKLSEELLETLVSIKNDDKDWNLTEFNLIDLLNEKNVKIDSIDANINCSLKTKYFSGIGKVFKLDTVIPFEESLLLKVLRDEVEECANWNVTVKEAKVVTKIRQDLSILHVCVHEQAGGLVSQRDFVNLNRYYFNDNMEQHILASIACKSDQVPVLESYVRGENGPTGYFFSRIDDNFTKFTWILNVNLKGWLPQYLIDQSLTMAQKDFI